MHHFSEKGRNVPVQDWKSFWSPLRLMALTSSLRAAGSPGDHILRPRKSDDAPHFNAGDTVRVRSAAEILSTLDMSGRLDGAPFMNGMLPWIGATATVLSVISPAAVVLEFSPGKQSQWQAEWLMPEGPATVLAARAEEAARRRLAALAADYPGA